jgi:hypothetical protein
MEFNVCYITNYFERKLWKRSLRIKCATDPLLRDDSVNRGRCHVAPAAYACVVTSNNKGRSVASGVLWGSAPGLYDSTEFSSASAIRLKVQLWSVNQRKMEAEESQLLRFVARKRLLKTVEEYPFLRVVTKLRLVEADWEDLLWSHM